MKHVAVILAGGSGNRFGAERPKQLLPLGGKSVLAWSLDAFERNAGIDEICIVAHPDTMETDRTIVSKGGWKKISRILPGGKERSDSSLAAIRAYSGTDACLLLHDAARPLISQRIIDDVLSALQTAQAVTTALPSADTIARVDGCGNVDNRPDRAPLRRIQTPQAFRLGTLEEAYSRASADPDFRAT
ncbi:MAG: 2-C-methyl-D-erythritol 4-phosphate cytidylyltransferase, partial [Alloprevotella sp.]|nr:2-C-methyl-D-erythritol 4-phosphate cytidylyltransferase [Alloprevotella sp.]